jgi:hypothetical protein
MGAADTAQSVIRTSLLAPFALLTAACATPPSAPAAAVTQTPRFGWVEGRCLVVTTPLAALPQTIWIAPADKGGAMVEARAIAPVNPASTEAAAACNALHSDRAAINREGHVFYTLGAVQPFDLAIAAFDPPQGEAREYEVCFTSEGARFTVTRGKRVEWEDYYYLGYDVEPTCA